MSSLITLERRSLGNKALEFLCWKFQRVRREYGKIF